MFEQLKCCTLCSWSRFKVITVESNRAKKQYCNSNKSSMATKTSRTSTLTVFCHLSFWILNNNCLFSICSFSPVRVLNLRLGWVYRSSNNNSLNDRLHLEQFFAIKLLSNFLVISLKQGIIDLFPGLISFISLTEVNAVSQFSTQTGLMITQWSSRS